MAQYQPVMELRCQCWIASQVQRWYTYRQDNTVPHKGNQVERFAEPSQSKARMLEIVGGKEQTTDGDQSVGSDGGWV